MDCGFSNDKGWFRYRSCAIIIEDGAVLMAKNKKDPYYYSVGGAVKLGETSEQAVIREVFEETGEIYEIDRLVYVNENFFTGTQDNIGLPCHEIAFYYLMKPRGIKLFNNNQNMYDVDEDMYWLKIDEYYNQNAFPTFFSKELNNISDCIKHIITVEDRKVKNWLGFLLGLGDKMKITGPEGVVQSLREFMRTIDNVYEQE